MKQGRRYRALCERARCAVSGRCRSRGNVRNPGDPGSRSTKHAAGRWARPWKPRTIATGRRPRNAWGSAVSSAGVFLAGKRESFSVAGSCARLSMCFRRFAGDHVIEFSCHADLTGSDVAECAEVVVVSGAGHRDQSFVEAAPVSAGLVAGSQPHRLTYRIEGESHTSGVARSIQAQLRAPVDQAELRAALLQVFVCHIVSRTMRPFRIAGNMRKAPEKPGVCEPAWIRAHQRRAFGSARAVARFVLPASGSTAFPVP